MPTECSAKPMGFAPVDGRAVVADFDGGEINSHAGGLLLGGRFRVLLDDVVYLLHQADGFGDSDDDLLVMLNVVL